MGLLRGHRAPPKRPAGLRYSGRMRTDGHKVASGAGIIVLCFFLSGATGLVYQVVWLRLLGLVFGHAVDALTAVLVAFMSGLALGSALGGRLSSRARAPLAIYAWLEAGIAVYALCLPPGLPGLTRVSL